MSFCGYSKVKLLGSGGMGSAYLVTDGRGYYVAKIPHTSDQVYIDKLKIETDTLKTLWGKGGHSNIVRYVNDCEYGRDRIPVLIEEYVEGERLDKAVNRIGNDSEAIETVLKCANVVNFLHSNGYIHRDIGSDNIILRKNSFDDPVFIDFGTVKRMWGGIPGAQMQSSKVSGKDYIAPELAWGYASEFSDVYSLGAVLLALLARNDNIRYFFKITPTGRMLMDRPSNLLNRRIPVEIENAVMRALDMDPSKRPTLSEFINLLSGKAMPVRGYSIEVMGKTYSLDRSRELTIGRENCDITYNEGHVTHSHAKIYNDGKNWVIEDLGSCNGTMIYRGLSRIKVYHGHRYKYPKELGHKAYLMDGDVIGIAFNENDETRSIFNIIFRAG